MDVKEIADLLREAKEFQFQQNSSIYNIKTNLNSNTGEVYFGVYGTGNGSCKDHYYGNYKASRIAEWLVNEPNRHKINGMRIEEFYAKSMGLRVSDFDVLEVL